MKLNALWWWIDRWRKSTAYTDMTLEEQGAYRNLIDEAHLRGGAVPNDDRVLARACGDPTKWKRVRVAVLRRFELREDGWHNPTLDEVLKESQRRAVNQANYRSRRDNKAITSAITSESHSDNKRTNKPDSPSPSPSPSPSGVGKEHLRPAAPLSARSNHPAFKGGRIVVFDWMLADLMAMLGAHADGFDWHAWFYELDSLAGKETRVITSRDERWKWIQEKTAEEAKRRGLRGAGEEFDSYRDGQHAWSCGACGEVHQGTLKQRGKCLKDTQGGVSA